MKADKERFEKTIVAAQKTMADYPGSSGCIPRSVLSGPEPGRPGRYAQRGEEP